MGNCMSDEVERQDGRLNHAYNAAISNAPIAVENTLRASESTWLKERDSTCEKAAAEFSGGSGEGMAFTHCMLDETIKRIIFLESEHVAPS